MNNSCHVGKILDALPLDLLALESTGFTLHWTTLGVFTLMFQAWMVFSWPRKTNHTYSTSSSYGTFNQRLDWSYMILKFQLVLLQNTWLLQGASSKLHFTCYVPCSSR